jgi:outer membrane protein OmpA-like peptidoglycan-associated protein
MNVPDLKAQLAWDLDDPDYNAPLVTIFGAGIAGLTVAHELAERGFHVQVVEPKESQFEEYECEIGGMAANQFSRVPAALNVVHPDLPNGELDRLRQIRRVYQHICGFERAQPRFPIKQRLRFDKQRHGKPELRLDEEVRRLAEQVRDLGKKRHRVRSTDRHELAERSEPYRAAPAAVSLADSDRVPPDWKDYWDEHDVKNASKLQEVLHIIRDAHAFYSARYAQREREVQGAAPKLKALPLDQKDPNRLREILLIRIIGYTDNDGLPEDNRALGEYWAGQVKDALIELNKNQRKEFRVGEEEDELKHHLETVGAGASQLRGDTDEPRGRARSNRVEFEVVEQVFPGEHGFRFFPNFYRHLFDTMRRTPLLSDIDPESRLTAFDQLVATPDAFLALKDDIAPFRARLRRFRTLIQIREALECFVDRLHFTRSDLVSFNLRFQRYMTSCPLRRQREAEACHFIKYFQGRRPYSSAALRFMNATPRALAAMSATETDARTQCNILLQLLGQDPLQSFVDDMTLNGPTSEVWLKHWKRYLIRQGVRFFVGRLRGLKLDKGDKFIPQVDGPDGVTVPRAEDPRYQLRGRMFDRSGELIEPDAPVPAEGGRRQLYVLALPFEQAAAVAESAREAATQKGIELQGPLQQLGEYAEACGRPAGGKGQPRRRDPITGRPREKDSMRDISGIQYFFPNNYRLATGHVYWVDSPWALTSISQLAFWRDRIQPVGEYIGQLSVDLGDWYEPYPVPAADGECEPGNSAWHSSRWEIAQNCWEQIKAGLAPEQRSVIKPPRYYHLDLGIVFSEEKFVGSHGNLILGVSPAALRQQEAERKKAYYRLLLIKSSPPEEPGDPDDRDDAVIEYESATDPPRSRQPAAMSKYFGKVAEELTKQINDYDRGRFAFAVHEPTQTATVGFTLSATPPSNTPHSDPSEILVSPVIWQDEIAIYFRGDSIYPYYIRLDDVVLVIPPASSPNWLPYYVERLQKELRDKMGGHIAIAFPGENHVVIKSLLGRPIACGVANREDMIELVDGPRLEAKSRFPNIQVLRRPGRTSGIARTAAFRANALIRAEMPDKWAVYPEPRRRYQLSVTVERAADRQLLPAKYRPGKDESASTLFDELCRQLRQSKHADLIHVEQIELGDAKKPRPAILISPYVRADEIVIRITGYSVNTFNLEIDGQNFEIAIDPRISTLSDDSVKLIETRDAILDSLHRELAGSPAHADIAVVAIGKQSLRLSRKAVDGAAPRPIAATVWNIDGKIEPVGAPVVEVRTKDLEIDLETRDPVPLRNDTPFQINPPGHWQNRPGHARGARARRRLAPSFPGEDAPQDASVFEYGHPDCPALQSWIATGTYMTTYTRLTTMEAANESGRHAVNAILKQLLEDVPRPSARKGSPQPARRLFGDYCRTWDVEDEEFEDLRFFKELDARLFAEGLPHVHDLLPMPEDFGLPMPEDFGMGDRLGIAESLHRVRRLGELSAVSTLTGLIAPSLLSKSMLHQLELLGDLLRRETKRSQDR